MTPELQALKIVNRGPIVEHSKVMMGDEDIAKLISSIYITMIAGKEITVDLELALPSGVNIDVDQANIQVTEETHELLVSLGWNPPR